MTELRPPTAQVDFAVYDPASGKIRWQGRSMVRDLPNIDVRSGEAVLEVELPYNVSYVDVSGPMPIGRRRPTFPAFDKLAIKADGKDAATLTLPIAATVVLDGVPHDVPAGPLRIPADSPGQYGVAIEAWPYLPFTAVVVAS